MADVVSIASSTRLELIKTQMTTWGSHLTVRNFWGFTEAMGELLEL
jgi:hypothetical protein